MKILSFDPGVNLGFAITDLDTTLRTHTCPESGVMSFESDLPITARLQELRQTIFEAVDKHKPDILCVEAVNRVFPKKSKDNATPINTNSDALYRIYGYIHEAGFEAGIRVVDMPIGTVKSVFADKGAAKKEAMILSAQKFTGRNITNNNEADAVGIGYTFAALYLEAIKESENESKDTSEFRRDFRAFARNLYKTGC